MSKKQNQCCIGTLSFITILFFLGLVIMVLVPLIEYNDYEETTCHITKIDYPQNLPNRTYTDNWQQCDCGYNCKAWTPCIKLYSNISENIVIQKDYYKEYNNGEECTFYDKKCKNGEDVIFTQEKLKESKNIYENYYNTTIKCYYNEDKNKIVLEKSFNMSTFIPIIIGLCLSCCCCCIQLCNYNSYDNQSSSHIV